MLFNLSTWGKLAPDQPNVFINGTVIVVRRQQFYTSSLGILIGTIVLFIGITLYEKGLMAFVSGTISLLGVLFARYAYTADILRKEQGGVHPQDTLLILNGSQKTLTKQINGSESRLAALQDTRFEISVSSNHKENRRYRLFITYPQGKELIARATTQASCNKLLKDIEEALNTK